MHIKELFNNHKVLAGEGWGLLCFIVGCECLLGPERIVCLLRACFLIEKIVAFGVGRVNYEWI